MSIIQSIIGSIQGGAPAPSCTWDGIWYEPINEGQQQTIRLSFQNWDNTTVYWEIYGGTSSSADFDVTSGSFSSPGTGNFTQDIHFTPVADATTEGSQTYYVKVGTTSGGNNIADQGPYTINDTSKSPHADFTIEWWQKMDSSQSGNPRIFGVGWDSYMYWGVSEEPNNGKIYVWTGNDGNLDLPSPSLNFNGFYGNWAHFAVVRHNDVATLYCNGNALANASNAKDIIGTLTPLSLGSATTSGSFNPTQFWKGKITDFHVMKGVAKYTGSTYSVPLSPVSNSAYTKLLLNAVDNTNKLVDSSTNARTVASTTGVTWDADTPYTGSSNGSLVFDGSTSYIKWAPDIDWAFDVVAPAVGGDGAPGTANGYTLTPTINTRANASKAYPGDTITWTVTDGTVGQTHQHQYENLYWWVDNDAVPPETWVEGVNNGRCQLDANGEGTFTLTVKHIPPTHALFRIYISPVLYQGGQGTTHGYIGV